MIRCKTFSCEVYDGCCYHCPERKECLDPCFAVPSACGESFEEPETNLTVFQSKALSVMKSIADLDRQKKLLEVQDAELRRQLQEAMDAHGVKSFENDILRISYVEPTTKTAIDSKRLKAELPEIADKYTKISAVKGYVKIVVK